MRGSLQASIRHSAIFCLLLICSTRTVASSFDFVDSTSGEVLARLHTDGMDPFDHSHVTGLSFTVDGDAKFGFGVGNYRSTFDSTFASNSWTSDGHGGLKTISPSTSGIFFDDTPPPSTVISDAQTPIFSIAVEPTHGRMSFVDGTLPNFIVVQGTWQATVELELPMLADMDSSGQVDFADFLILSSSFGETVSIHAKGDINGDGTVAFDDFLILSEHFGTMTRPVQHVPEPSAVILVLIAVLGLTTRTAAA